MNWQWVSTEKPNPWSDLTYTQLQLSFLTDQRDCCLFLAAGSQGQRFALRVVGGQLQLDMMFNSTLKFFVTFSGRAVADGLLHHVAVTRCSHLVELRLDDGEGVNYRT